MQNSLNTICDFCAIVLHGKQGTAKKKEPYITVRGSVCLVTYHEDTGNEDYTYLSQKNDLTFFHFCADKNCLIDYVNARKILREESKANRREDYAGYGGDWNDNA